MMNKLSIILSEKRELLISNFLEDKANDFYDRHAMLYDEYFFKNFEASRVGPLMNFSKNPFALVALGGYGRREQSVHSDVDLLFLFSDKVPERTEDLIKEMVYPLWDIGIEVGYSTLTIKECILLAGADFEVLMSILDGRFLCGLSTLYSKLMEALKKKVIRVRPERIISMIVENNRKRHDRFGDSTYLLEPNLKEGQGGLRDFHTMLWIARIRSDLKQPRDLEYSGYISQSEFEELTKALFFIRKVRNLLHYLSGRKCDQLYLEYQTPLAGLMRVENSKGLEAVEKVLGDLHGQMEFVKQQHKMFLAELGYLGKIKSKKYLSGYTSNINGLELKRNMLGFASTQAILKSPQLLIRIFEQSTKLSIPLSADAKRIEKEFLYLVDDDFRSSRSAVRVFERILVTPAPEFNVLNQMVNTGFLVKFIPEFKGIINRIQYDEYHLYPVHKHSLRTVQTAKKFGEGTGDDENRICHDLYKDLIDKKPLLWACLLHDIGKSENKKGHSDRGAGTVKKILGRMNYKIEDIDIVSDLIKKHLFLIKVATRRDINDEETAIFCAREIKEPENLRMLYLLSVADSMSTGPKAWNDWTSTLLRELFLKIMNILQKGEFATNEAVDIVKKKKKALISSFLQTMDGKTAETTLSFMPPRYLLYVSSEDIIEHIGLVNRLGDSEFVWNIVKDTESDTREVTVCAKNRPGLFSRIAGIFTLNSLNIIDAQIYTWRNNIALDIFRVTPPMDPIFENEKWRRTENDLKAVLSDKFDLSERIFQRISENPTAKTYTFQKPHQVKVDNDGSSFFTIVEIFTYDFQGLLFRITDAIFKCGVDIHVAKIATQIDQVVDVFYVRDLNGNKINSPDQVRSLKSAIEDVLPIFNS